MLGAELIAELPSEQVLWTGSRPPEDCNVLPLNRLRRLLGKSFDAVVLDFHDGMDPDAIGRAHGFVRGGGALILRLPDGPLEPRRRKLAAYPFQPGDVGRHFERRLELALADTRVHHPAPLGPVSRSLSGTRDQQVLVAALLQAWRDPEPVCISVLADRGRGKSAALGLALGQQMQWTWAQVAVTAGQPDAVEEVLRFAAGREDELDPGAVSDEVGAAKVGTEASHPDDSDISAELADRLFVPLHELVFGHEQSGKRRNYELILVDEAAQIPVPMLQRLVRRYPKAHFVFATTTHGYEGTGRGFSLRFLKWLEGEPRPVHRLTLEEPIRWAAGDPLEARVFAMLLLDAEPAPVDDPDGEINPGSCVHVAFEPAELAGDERVLRQVFGLLVHAHYRTTPGDLQRMLDAPNIHVHALMHGDSVVAATWVAEEGGWTVEMCNDVYRGRQRLRGHALPETLVSHLGHREAGAMRSIRSVRIATHPALRRRGLGTRLIEAIHEAYEVDFFGTLFGATEGLLRFRRSVGYELVRVGASRGSRTGEPAAVMVRPVSSQAEVLMTSLRAELARDLPLQLELLEAGNEILLEDGMRRSLLHGLPVPAELNTAALEEMVELFVSGPRTMEAAATGLRAYALQHRAELQALDEEEEELIRARVLEGKSWPEVMKVAAMPSIPATMRALRRAFRALVAASDP